MKTLRPYQQNAIDELVRRPPGNYLINLACGMGKTFTASQIPRNGRLLWLANTIDLVEQPKYCFDDIEVGIEMGTKKSNGEEVVLASIQSLHKRLNKFKPDDFEIVIADECQYSAAETYRKCLEYFTPKYRVGLSATPKRSDGVRLDDLFDEIIVSHSLDYAVANGILCPIYCKRIQINYNLANARISGGDYTDNSIGEVMRGTEAAVAEVYKKHARGSTLIFAANVKHAFEISRCIEDCAVIVGTTPKEERKQILKDFSDGKIPCLISVNIARVGLDVPIAETAIFCRPTKSESLYQQMAGRIMRKHPAKKSALLIDLVGVSDLPMVTAPSLLGIDMTETEKKEAGEKECQLTVPKALPKYENCLEGWITSVKETKLLRADSGDFATVYFKTKTDGTIYIELPNNVIYEIPPVDLLGNVVLGGKSVPYIKATEIMFNHLSKYHYEHNCCWSSFYIAFWMQNYKIDRTIKEQLERVESVDLSGLDMSSLKMGAAGAILCEEELYQANKRGDKCEYVPIEIEIEIEQE